VSMPVIVWFELVGLVSFGLGVFLGGRAVLWYYDVRRTATREAMESVINVVTEAQNRGTAPVGAVLVGGSGPDKAN
jgi:hypothetical protein